MKYGCNYSKELIDILRDNKEFCDYVKIGAFGKTEEVLKEAFLYRPLLIHGFGWYERGGMPSIKEMDFEYMNSYLKFYKSPFLAMHALAFESDMKVLNSGESISDHMIQIFKQIQQSLDIPLLIENLDYSPFYSYETTVLETVLPEFLTRVILETNAYFLFDLSHAKVSAYQLQMNIYDYIDHLPLESIKEIHFSGSFYSKDEGYKDIHGIMNEEDYQIAAYLANNPRIKAANQLEIVTLEYGTIEVASKDAILDQMQQLKGIFG